MFVLNLSEFKIRIKCRRLIELTRTGLEREKRPPHNFSFEHFTSLFFQRTTKKKGKVQEV